MTVSPVKPIATDLPQLPPTHLKQILRTLPKECFEKQPRQAWTAVAISLAMVGLGELAIAFSPWFLLPIAWFFAGTAATGLFVLGHDCGHRSFAKRRWVNDWVGHLMMMPLIYPFHSWRILHDFHHKHTNKLHVDNAWQPWQPEAFDQSGAIAHWGYRLFRSRLWFLASIIHWFGIHFNLENFAAKDRKKVAVSIAVVVAFAAIAFPLLIATTGVWGFVKFWLMPWLAYHFWMSTFTLVHHTDPEIAFEPIESWNAAQAQLMGTVHCNYPRWVEWLCHDISVHVPHHISTAIPSYNLWKAHRSLQQSWGAWMQPERQFSWKMMREIVDRCHLYNRDSIYHSFAQHRARR